MSVGNIVGLGIVVIGGYLVVTKWGEIDAWLKELTAGKGREDESEEAVPITTGNGRVWIRVNVEAPISYPKGYVESKLNVCVDGVLHTLYEYADGWYYVDMVAGSHTIYVDPPWASAYTVSKNVPEGEHVKVTILVVGDMLPYELTECPGAEPEPAPGVDTGKVSIKTTPSTAKVYRDGVYKGKTPFSANWEPGTYKVTLTLSGYEDFGYVSFEVVKDLTTEVSPTLVATDVPVPVEPVVPVEPAMYTITIKGLSGALVYMDDALKGTIDGGKFVITNVSEGSHIFKTTLAEHAFKQTTVDVTGSKTISLYNTKIYVEPVPTKVSVTFAGTANAQIWLKNTYLGSVGETILMDKGKYTFVAKRSGYDDLTKKSVNIQSSRSVTFNLTVAAPTVAIITKVSKPSIAGLWSGIFCKLRQQTHGTEGESMAAWCVNTSDTITITSTVSGTNLDKGYTYQLIAEDEAGGTYQVHSAFTSFADQTISQLMYSFAFAGGIPLNRNIRFYAQANYKGGKPGMWFKSPKSAWIFYHD